MTKSEQLTRRILQDFEMAAVPGDDLRCTWKNAAAPNLIMQVKQIEETTRQLIKAKSTIFSVRKTRHGMWCLHYGKLGKRIIKDLDHVHFDLLGWQYPRHNFNPYYKLFAQTLFRDPGRAGLLTSICQFVSWQSIPGGHKRLQSLVDELNAFVEEISRKAKESGFKTKERDFQRNVNKNCLSLKTYFHGLLRFSPRLMVVRVNLSFKPDPATNAIVTIASEVAEDKFNQLRRSLGKKKKGGVFEYLRGHAGKREYSFEGKEGMHLVCLFDADKVSNDIAWLARTIGEHWINEITDGLGQYYDCGSLRAWDNAQAYGIGVVGNEDAAALKTLDSIALSLTKPDGYIRLDSKLNKRSLIKGQLPRK